MEPLLKNGVCSKKRNEFSNALQLSKDKNTVSKAAALFLKKWKDVNDPLISIFIEYLRREWLEKNFSWFEGVAPDLRLKRPIVWKDQMP